MKNVECNTVAMRKEKERNNSPDLIVVLFSFIKFISYMLAGTTQAHDNDSNYSRVV